VRFGRLEVGLYMLAFVLVRGRAVALLAPFALPLLILFVGLQSDRHL
jgi:hypothetical protein